MNDDNGPRIPIVVWILLAAVFGVGGMLGGVIAGRMQAEEGLGRLKAAEERLGRLEQRDVQVRECLQRNLLPPGVRMLVLRKEPTTAQMREWMTTGLDKDSLEWVNVDPAWNFGVDRRWLKPAGPTGATGQLGEHRPEK